MATSSPDLNDAFEHLSRMLDSAVTQDIPRSMGRLEELKVKLSLRLSTPQAVTVGPPRGKEQYLKVQDVIARFPVTAKWLYRHKKELPHVQPTRKTLLFPEGRFTRWWEQQRRNN
jgi:hypothetical protein